MVNTSIQTILIGYKHTELGMIPDDWRVRQLKEIFKLKNGFAFRSEFFSDTGPIVITPGNFRLDGGLNFNERNTIRYSGKYSSSMQFYYGDLLIVMTDLTPDCNLLGKPGFINTKEVILHNQRIGKINLTSKSVNKEYLYWFFLSEYYAKRMKETATGSTVRHTSVSSIYNTLIPIPTKSEQTAIVNVLSDTNALIEHLDKLIAKKKDIKQGAMQQLLTGKKRLQGFEKKKNYKQTEMGEIPEDWNFLKITNATIPSANSIKIGPFGSALKKEYLTDYGFKVYGQENIYQKDMSIGDRFISVARFRELKSCEVISGDFLISMMGTVGKCMIVPKEIDPGIMDSHLLRIKFDTSKIDSSFVAQLFETRIIFDQIKQLSVGGIMEGLSSKIIKGINIPLPPTKNEQIAIATILSDMDVEIEKLKQKRDKYIMLKQGMMQQLLTGRIRIYANN